MYNIGVEWRRIRRDKIDIVMSNKVIFFVK